MECRLLSKEASRRADCQESVWYLAQSVPDEAWISATGADQNAAFPRKAYNMAAIPQANSRAKMLVRHFQRRVDKG